MSKRKLYRVELKGSFDKPFIATRHSTRHYALGYLHGWPLGGRNEGHIGTVVEYQLDENGNEINERVVDKRSPEEANVKLN